MNLFHNLVCFFLLTILGRGLRNSIFYISLVQHLLIPKRLFRVGYTTTFEPRNASENDVDDLFPCWTGIIGHSQSN